jgi:O-antigen/teichoic acid export membrane protein
VTTSRVRAAPQGSRTDRALAGWLWLSCGTGAQGALTVAVLAALARLLTPADFGVVSASLLVIDFTWIFAQGGVGAALVQHPAPRPRHLDTAFTVSVIGSLLLGAALWGAAPTVAGWLRVRGLAPVLRALVWLLPLQALGVVADSMLRRDLQFRTVSAVRVAAYGAGYGGVGLSLAVLGAGAWALVAAEATQALLSASLLVAAQRRRGRALGALRIGATELRELLTFGGGFALARVGNYAAVHGDEVVTARWLGVGALGLYERAYQLMTMPAVLVGQVLDEVLFPAMAQVQRDRERLATAYRRCVAGVALLTLPLSAVLVVLAPEIVAVLLGPGWGGAVAPLRILAVATMFRTSYTISDSLARAVGAVYRRAWRQWVYAALVVAGSVVGQRWGIAGVAWGVAAALLANFLMMARLSLQLVAMPWRELVAAHAAGARAALGLGAVAWVAASAARALVPSSPAAVLCVTLGAVAATACAVLAAAGGGALGPDGRWLADRMARLLSRRRRVPSSPTGPEGAPGLTVADGASRDR